MPDTRVKGTRRQAIQYAPSTGQVATLGSLRGKFHWHFCIERDCRLVYSDACTEVRRNARCHHHRGAAARPLWVASRDPVACCIDNCLMVGLVDELVRYQLAGPGPWFQCQTCFRASGWPCA